MEFPSNEVRSADFIQGVDEDESDNRFINRGRLLHTLFSAIETEKDIDNAIDQLIFEGIIGKPETEDEIRELTRHCLSIPLVQDWYSGDWQLFNEWSIDIGKKKGNSEPADNLVVIHETSGICCRGLQIRKTE